MSTSSTANFRARLSVLAIVSGILLFAACGSNSYKNTVSVSTAPANAVPALAAAVSTAPATAASALAAATPAGSAVGGGAAVAVEIKGTAFPAAIAVKQGTTVTWTNKDSFAHTVSADIGQAETFNSKSLEAGGSFSTTFTKAGTYTYYCSYHASMAGKVIVGDLAAGVSTPAASPTKSDRPGYKY